MKITWINPAPIIGTNENRTSERVCVRLRSMLPGDELRRRGHDVEQVFFHELPERLRDQRFLQRDVFVFGKAFHDFSPLINAIHASTQARVLIDICDNVFAPPEDGLKSVYLAMLPLADAIVASSDTLAVVMQDKISPGAMLFSIPDAVEGVKADPVFAPNPGLINLLWFGYPNNLPLLENEIKNLSKLTDIVEVSLTVVTAWLDQAAPPQTIIDGIRVRYRQWSQQVMKYALKACDIVVIPSDNSPSRITKTANRIITALWGGKFVAAYPLPSYQPFQPFAQIDRDLVAGIRSALENQDATRERIAMGQQYIQDHHAPKIIADAWEHALKRTKEMTPDRKFSTQPIKSST